jgi:hypothetical protein
MSDDAIEAARRSLDPQRQLPGENLDSMDPNDAAHWVQVYRQLLETKQTLADALGASLPEVGREAREELEGVDLVLIRVQLDRFERRFSYWSARQRELEAGAVRKT